MYVVGEGSRGGRDSLQYLPLGSPSDVSKRFNTYFETNDSSFVSKGEREKKISVQPYNVFKFTENKASVA